MSGERLRKKPSRLREQSVLEMTSAQAKAFLLKPESYCNIDLPIYLQFAGMLSAVSKILHGTSLPGLQKETPRNFECVNYSMLSNKDGRHAWRPLQLIHPALYVSLVEHITTKSHWETIRKRFSEFQGLANFKCLSIPVKSLSGQKDKAEQILQWWQGIEQGSIELALDYAYVLHADITDCYAAIYTHSIAWALHEKSIAKEKRNDESLIGNLIDAHIQDMSHGQTNGIPQGSVLMDLISEMVLGYADLQLSNRLTKDGISEYRILRYRDDYRIFVNNTQTGEAILKALTEVMIELGLKLNTAKMTGSQSVVSSSLKLDKRAWLRGRQGDPNLQKHLLVIHAHGIDYPNSGSLTVGLARFHERLSKAKTIRNPLVLISIAVDIAYNSPRTFPVCAAIVSRLLSELESNDARVEVIRKIHRKLSQLPNAGHMEIWLQRISHPYEPRLRFNEDLCRLVKGKNVPIWNNNWVSSTKLKRALEPDKLVNQNKLKSLKPVVRPEEIKMFASERY